LIRGFVLSGAMALGLSFPAAAQVRYPEVTPGYAFSFPRDHGAHPDFRNEWWYATGWLTTGSGEVLGFQVTFFRTRPDIVTDNPSAFTPRQILLAHAAITEARHGRLQHDQRAARPALGLAGASETTTEVWIDDWKLGLDRNTYRTRIPAREFTLELDLAAASPPLLQGEGGVSRKGKRPGEASYYYSRPHLQVRGTLGRGGSTQSVTGTAWLDHEWSSSYLAPEAAGWDWIGINLAGGGALMAFRMRGKDGGVVYAGGTLLGGDGSRNTFGPQDVTFEPLRRWRSTRTGAEYPVAMRVRAGGKVFRIEPLMDDQELDSRASTGTIYWEGAVRLFEDAAGGKAGAEAGRGYLELTGYWRPLKF
jgi:predicted secreted hydrolase